MRVFERCGMEVTQMMATYDTEELDAEAEELMNALYQIPHIADRQLFQVYQYVFRAKREPGGGMKKVKCNCTLPQCGEMASTVLSVADAAVDRNRRTGAIFVDDASDDAGETWALLEEFERAYPESIMIIHLEENLRQGGARNVALGYATGEYLAFVDADDFVEKDFLEKVYRRAVESEADIVQFDYVYYTERLGKVASGRTTADESIRFRQRRSGSVSLSARRSPTAVGTSCTGDRLWSGRASVMPSMSFMKNRCLCIRCCSTETALKSWRKLFTATARMRWEPCAGICVR